MTRKTHTSIPLLLTAALAAVPQASVGAAVVAADHLDLELVSELRALVPGQPTWLGLRLRHAPHWHSYWINPGDSGLPTRLAWTLPADYRAGEIAWPAPSRFDVSGLYNFGFDGEHLLAVAIDVPVHAQAGSVVTFTVEAKWLVCREECIPGTATLSLALPIVDRDAAQSANAQRFAAARSTLPQQTAWTGSAGLDGDRVKIELHGDDLPAAAGLDVFAVQRRVLGNAPAVLRRRGDALVIDAPKSDYLDELPATLDLVLTDRAARARQVRVVFDPLPFQSPRSPTP